MRFTDNQQKTGQWIRTLSAQSYRGWKAFYHTKEWRAKRKEILDRDHSQCQRCRARGRYTMAVTVHHIKHLKDAPELALSDSNLQSLCEACHNEVHPEKQYTPNSFRNEEKW